MKKIAWTSHSIVCNIWFRHYSTSNPEMHVYWYFHLRWKGIIFWIATRYIVHPPYPSRLHLESQNSQRQKRMVFGIQLFRWSNKTIQSRFRIFILSSDQNEFRGNEVALHCTHTTERENPNNYMYVWAPPSKNESVPRIVLGPKYKHCWPPSGCKFQHIVYLLCSLVLTMSNCTTSSSWRSTAKIPLRNQIAQRRAHVIYSL